MPLYLYVLIGSIIVPFLFSIFYIDFIKNWKNFSISTLIVAVIFLIWDAVFTQQEIWGFNPHYCLGLYIFKMPIEEFLFFFIIPFCSLFTHYALYYAFPKLQLKKKTTSYVTIIIILLISGTIILNFTKAYTSISFTLLAITLIVGKIFFLDILQNFYLSFLFILIPFFLVNGILTGSVTESPIVWYNDLETLGIRLITIPIEDIGYAFTMLFSNLMLLEYFNKRYL